MRRSGPVFCPPVLWAQRWTERTFLWTAESSARTVHRATPVSHSGVPRFTRVLNRPTRHPGVTPFTRPGERARRLAEQWTGLWRSCVQLATPCGWSVENLGPELTPPFLSTACGLFLCTHPQGPELGRSCRIRCTCGGFRDNFPVPRVWTGDWRPICGKTAARAPDSNSEESPGAGPGAIRELEALRRSAEERVGASVGAVGSGGGSEGSCRQRHGRDTGDAGTRCGPLGCSHGRGPGDARPTAVTRGRVGSGRGDEWRPAGAPALRLVRGR